MEVEKGNKRERERERKGDGYIDQAIQKMKTEAEVVIEDIIRGREHHFTSVHLCLSHFLAVVCVCVLS